MVLMNEDSVVEAIQQIGLQQQRLKQQEFERTPRYKYECGIKLMKEGAFWRAEKALQSLGEYQDSVCLANKCAEIKKWEKRYALGCCSLVPIVLFLAIKYVAIGESVLLLVVPIIVVIPLVNLRLAAMRYAASKIEALEKGN